MQATAIAQPNIALIKYWGKRDVVRNLPAVGSISITLSELHTEVCVDLAAGVSTDQLKVNGADNRSMLPRISTCLDNILGRDRPPARVASNSNFPIAAGLASSASAFAATTVAAVKAANLSLGIDAMAKLAGQASGSAARSLFDGFAELTASANGIDVVTIRDVESWPLSVVVAITQTGPKAIGSTEAMELSRKTSPFYDRWIESQDVDLDTAREAICARNFSDLAQVAEHNCLKMHSVMWASRPPMVYWNAATLRCMDAIRQLQAQGHKVFFTIDAGPQVKAVCEPHEAALVASVLATTAGVQEVRTTGLGAAARLVENK